MLEFKTKNEQFSNRKSLGMRIKSDLRRNYALYCIMIPVMLWYLYFQYKPILGIQIAFRNFNMSKGIWLSPWVGLNNFKRLFADPYFLRNIRNTIVISLSCIVFAFPAPILLALLINEVKRTWFKKTVQTLSYLPHFISMVVICGMITDFVSSGGIITGIVEFFSGRQIEESLLNNQNLFVPIYVISNIWETVGWGSIIYLAALSGIDETLYEAAEIDGAGKLLKTLKITLPCLAPTIVTMLILRMGHLLGVGYEKIMLLVNQYNAENAEVLSYYIYKKGILSNDYGLSTAASLFNSIINLFFVLLTNTISRKVSENSLW